MYEAKLRNFQGGGEVLEKISSLREVCIFSGTTYYANLTTAASKCMLYMRSMNPWQSEWGIQLLKEVHTRYILVFHQGQPLMFGLISILLH